MKKIRYSTIKGNSAGYLALLALLGAFAGAGLVAAYFMEHYGHYITGMNNQIVWGTPHVFAVFLIVAASGALNTASIASVFSKTAYKPLARLSGLLAIALLAGGLMILVLDLGRADRLVVAMTYYNFKSIFAWNIILYNGFFLLVAIYLWTMMDPTMSRYTKTAGVAAFVWRLILTTGTGSIFGFLVARLAYNEAIMAPLFIVMSFAFGLAILILVTMAACKWTGRPLGDALMRRLKNLLGVFIAGTLLLLLAYHLTKLYITQYHGVEAFILRDGGVYTQLFWLGWILLGSLVPLAIVYHPAWGKNRSLIGFAATLVILGGLAAMYVIIIGGQAYPLLIFPGKEVVSSFSDGVINSYTPSLPEFALGVGGFAVALIIVALAVKVLQFLPESLADEVVDPHHK
ncbi:MAG TPA: molybdopterin oxidoreductase [Gammaproteobacteria bacterium]|nr:molybdopterin oxidoreductase [Gammaproteobacteria bacterium]